MTRILVTGAGGFVGSHLIHALKERGEYEIFAAVYKSTSDVSDLIPADHIIEGDLTDATFANRLIEQTQPEVIFHLAALSVVHSSDKQATTVMNANTTLQYNLLEATKNFAPHARFLAICSANEYGLVENTTKPIDELTPLRPLNPYAVSKVTQEMLSLQYHLAYGLDTVMLRPFNHTGPGQTIDFVIPALAKQFVEIKKGQHPPTIEVGNLDNTRDYTDVVDMVEAYILASTKGRSGEIYNIGSGRGATVGQLIEMFKKITGLEVEVTVKDEMVRVADVPSLICDATKFHEATGWSPKVALEQTLKNVYTYWEGHV